MTQAGKQASEQAGKQGYSSAQRSCMPTAELVCSCLRHTRFQLSTMIPRPMFTLEGMHADEASLSDAPHVLYRRCSQSHGSRVKAPQGIAHLRATREVSCCRDPGLGDLDHTPCTVKTKAKHSNRQPCKVQQ